MSPDRLGKEPAEKEAPMKGSIGKPISVLELLKPLAFLIWIAGFVAAFYVVQKPWAAAKVAALPMAMLDLVLAGTLLVILGGLGKRLLGDLEPSEPLESMAIQLAVGIIPVATLLLGLGVIGLFRWWVFWGLLVIGLALLAKESLAWLRGLRALASVWSSSGAMGRFIWLFSATVLSISLMEALAPPIKWDSLAYHLEMPQRYLDAGRFFFLDDVIYFGFPQTAEMLFTWAMGLHSGSTAAVLGWGVGVIALAGVTGFALRLLGNRAGMLTPAIFLVGVSIANGLSWAYVDLWVMLFGVTVFITLDHFSRTNQRRWLILAGLGAGAAFATKYTGGFVVILGAALLLTEAVRRFLSARKGAAGEKPFSMRTVLSWGLLFGCVAFIVSLPWLLKNLFFTGNPLYPFFFGGKQMDALRQSFFLGARPGRSLLDDLLIPITATILGVEDAFDYSTSIGPLFLALIPGLAIGWRRFSPTMRESLIRFLGVGAATWILWASTAHISDPFLSTRFHFGALPALAILSIAGYEAICRIRIHRVRMERVVNALIILTLTFALLSQVYMASINQPLAVVLGTQTAGEYISRHLAWHQPAMQAVSALPQESKVLLLWEPRSYYCGVMCDPDEILDQWWYLFQVSNNLDEIESRLKDAGFSHVLIYNLGARYIRETSTDLSQEQWLALDRFLAEHLRLLETFGDAYQLYALK